MYQKLQQISIENVRIVLLLIFVERLQDYGINAHPCYFQAHSPANPAIQMVWYLTILVVYTS